jgi:hypothetical protein
VTCEGWENDSRCFIGFFFFFAKTVTDSDLNDKKLKGFLSKTIELRFG